MSLASTNAKERGGAPASACRPKMTQGLQGYKNLAYVPAVLLAAAPGWECWEQFTYRKKNYSYYTEYGKLKSQCTLVTHFFIRSVINWQYHFHVG